MDEHQFDRRIGAAQRRLQDLLRHLGQSGTDEDGLLAVATQELSNSLEELHVAHEELHQQNEELTAAREQLAAERERYQALCAFAPAGYLVTDAAGIIQEANRAACELLGMSQDNLTGKPLAVFLAPGEQGHFYAQINHFQTDGEARQEPWETRLQPRNGAPFPAAVTVGAVRDASGALTSLRWLMRDVTSRKRVETERERLIDELDAFAHTVAHDLRGPLTLVLGYATVLMENGVALTPEELRTHLRAIATSGRQMSNIIEDLLLLASVRRSESVELEPLHMAYVVDEALARLAYQIKESEAKIVLPEDWPRAMGYGPWVVQVWVNYASNAIRYGGAPPRVELGGEQLLHGMVRFWVRDNGEGISEERLPRLFVPFTQLAKMRAEGHGLGLSIARRIVERLGGEVGIESEVGQGSVFWFTLPAAPRLT